MEQSGIPGSREVERRQMVERQLVARGISAPRVLAAMARVPREEFVLPTLQDEAYDDHASPIECGQTISQPFTVAFMADAAQIQETDRVLEIGTGSGYGAAVLSLLAQEVHTVERIPQLVASSAARLQRLGYANVQVHFGDGTLGLPAFAPFDAILVTAGAMELPDAYLDQLSDGGRIVIPIGETRNQQRMVRFTRQGDELASKDLGGFVFVPLIGEQGWREY